VIRSIPDIRVTDQATRDALEAMKEIIEVMLGRRGSDPNDHVLTRGDSSTIVKLFEALNTGLSHDTLADVSADDHHSESHTVVSHTDTTVTGAELNADHSKLAGVEASAKDDQVASEVTNTPAGNIAATDVQAAIDELDTEKEGTATSHAARHVTGGGDTIADAIAAGNAGLMTGADKTKINGIETGAEVNNISDANATDLTDGGDTVLHDHDGISENTAARHAQSHNVASHSDTTATGAELETLTDNSIANTLHRHSELVASDGSPDPALSVDADGKIGVGTSTPSQIVHIKSAGSDHIRLERTGDTNQYISYINNGRAWHFEKPTGDVGANENTMFRMGVIGSVDAHNPFWNGFQFIGHTVTESSVSRYPMLTIFARSAIGTDPTDYEFVFSANNLGTLPGGNSFAAPPVAGSFIRFGFGQTPTTPEVMRIVYAGNVGIGTTTPDTKLQVVGDVKFGDDNTNYMTVDGSGNQSFAGAATLTLINGTSINEFSTDDTLAGDSDDAVPTEKAVKTYVDSKVVFKSFNVTTQGLGASPDVYAAGFYEAPAADADLTQANLTQTLGTANKSEAAHAFLVASGAGATDGSDLVITVTGISITDAGVRNAADSEVIVADATAMSTDEYFETTKKWLGQITYTLSSTAGTAYSATFNYGFTKYEDYGNRDFTITDFEVVGLAGANDNDLDITLFHHHSTGWTYNAAAFIPGGTKICQMSTDHSTDDQLVSSEHFAYKRAGLSTSIAGSGIEGVIVLVTSSANNAIEYANIHIGVTF